MFPRVCLSEDDRCRKTKCQPAQSAIVSHLVSIRRIFVITSRSLRISQGQSSKIIISTIYRKRDITEVRKIILLYIQNQMCEIRAELHYNRKRQ